MVFSFDKAKGYFIISYFILLSWLKCTFILEKLEACRGLFTGNNSLHFRQHMFQWVDKRIFYLKEENSLFPSFSPQDILDGSFVSSSVSDPLFMISNTWLLMFGFRKKDQILIV